MSQRKLPSRRDSVVDSERQMTSEWYSYMREINDWAGLSGPSHEKWNIIGYPPAMWTRSSMGIVALEASFVATNTFNGNGHMDNILTIPYGYEEGTDIYPMLIWAPGSAGSGDIHFESSYLVANPGSKYGSSLSDKTIASTPGVESQMVHTLFEKIPGKGIRQGSSIALRLARIADAEDTYADDAVVFWGGIVLQESSFGRQKRTP